MVTISSVPSQGIGSKSNSLCRSLFMALLMGVVFISICSAQTPFPTGHSNNQRTGANVNETLLTPANVNKNGFGLLFSYPLDFAAVAQPLFMPAVNIPGQGVHNVVYVATMADSIYAFDADNNLGAPLWWVNFTNPAAGITTASGQYLPCSGTASQEGIPGTPTIDTTTGTIYLVAKTVENGTVVHRLHALDITTGQEKFGGPTVISATSVSLKGHVTVFNSLHQKERPGLLLSNGTIYIGFGSNGCNDGNSGWLLAYDATSLQQVGSFNTSPDSGLTSIWQTGNGISADEFGNIYAITAESNLYDVPFGGQSYCHSVLQFTPAPSFGLNDYFTPSDVAFLNAHDLDLSSGGPVVLPDQPGPYPHLVVGAGKEGTIYVLNRDNGMMGQYSTGDANLNADGGQELPDAVGHMFSSPAYWNSTLYYAGNADPIKGFSVGAGTTPLSPTPVISSPKKYVGSHSPSISANENTDGILWVISGNNLYALNALTLVELYDTGQVASRDALPPFAHFITQTVANGKVYVGTQTTLQAYGLFQNLSVVGGNNQTAPVLTALPAPIQLQVVNPYTGAGLAGVTVSFSDGGKKGIFNPPSVVSDVNGNVATSYTLGKTTGVYTITASAPNAASMALTETAVAAVAAKIITYSGNKQTQQAGSVLASAMRIQVRDASGNGVPGVTVTFVDPTGLGTITPSTGVSDSKGLVAVGYQLPNRAGTFKIVVNSPPLKAGQLTEYATGDSPANLMVTSGNNQSAPINSPLPVPIVVQVVDAGGVPVPGVSVIFSAPTGTLSATTVTSDSNGNATVNYTTGSSSGTFTINAAVNSLNTQITVNVTSQ